MSRAEKSAEPSMDEILASIRKIIAEDPAVPRPSHAQRPQTAPQRPAPAAAAPRTAAHLVAPAALPPRAAVGVQAEPVRAGAAQPVAIDDLIDDVPGADVANARQTAQVVSAPRGAGPSPVNGAQQARQPVASQPNGAAPPAAAVNGTEARASEARAAEPVAAPLPKAAPAPAPAQVPPVASTAGPRPMFPNLGGGLAARPPQGNGQAAPQNGETRRPDLVRGNLPPLFANGPPRGSDAPAVAEPVQPEAPRASAGAQSVADARPASEAPAPIAKSMSLAASNGATVNGNHPPAPIVAALAAGNSNAATQIQLPVPQGESAAQAATAPPAPAPAQDAAPVAPAAPPMGPEAVRFAEPPRAAPLAAAPAGPAPAVLAGIQAAAQPVAFSAPPPAALPAKATPADAAAPALAQAAPTQVLPANAQAPLGAGAQGGDITPAVAPAQVPPVMRTLEDSVAELLRPMLQQWLDANMPRIVEKALKVELAQPRRTDKLT